MNSTNFQPSTSPAIVGNNVLSPVVVEALQSDAHLKELYKRLAECFKLVQRLVAVFCQTTVISRFYSCLA
jgi:hypothetical protein